MVSTAQMLRKNCFEIDNVVTNFSSAKRMMRLGFPVDIYTDERILNIDSFRNDKSVVLIVNFPAIVNDEILSAGPVFYNLHNGDTRKYRGLSEICIVSAIINRENSYGQTIQRILPGQKVDSGPVVARSSFSLSEQSDFEEIMDMSIKNYVPFWLAHLNKLKSCDAGQEDYGQDFRFYSNSSLPSLVQVSRANGTFHKLRLGRYENYFPRLKAALKNF